MTIFRTWVDDPEATAKLAGTLLDMASLNCNPWTHVPALALIGNPHIIGDAVGPLVGDELNRMCYSGPLVGDSLRPVVGSTWNYHRPRLYTQCAQQNRAPFTIAVDAAVGKPGRLVVQTGPLAMGEGTPTDQGFHSEVVSIGDVGFFCGMFAPGQFLKEIDPELVRRTVNVVAGALFSFWEQWDQLTMTEFELTAAAAMEVRL